MARILVTSASYLLTDHLLSSEGNSCYKLFKKLEKFGYFFDVISAQIKVKKPLKNAVFHQVGFFEILPTTHALKKYLSHGVFLTRSYLKSMEILKKQRIDIIHHIMPAVYDQTFNLLVLLGKTKKHPFIFGPISTHFYPRPLDEKFVGRFTSKLHVKTVRNCDRLIAITNYVKKLYTKIFDPEKIETIPLGVDTNLFKPSKKELNREYREILSAGYLYKLKGIEFLIKAMHIVAQERKDVKLRIVGNGPEKQHLIRLTEALNIRDKVIFQGVVPHTEMPKYYQNCDIFCFPTLGEPFGKAVIEAMACAKPVIASNVGGPAETIKNRKNGILVTPAQPKLWAQEILNLLKNEKTMRLIGAEARNTILREYSWDKIAEKYHNLYTTLM
jgi:glycosyltransferase involved in cell wall biosynthesis